MRKTLILAFILLGIYASAQDTTVISGRAPSYSGQSITLFKYSDYITFRRQTISRSTADSAGNFSFEFVLDKTTKLFTDLGSYNGVIYCEPGKQYQVILPVYKPRTLNQSLNPFYKPPRTRLIVINDTNALSNRIAYFDKLLSQKITYSAQKRIKSKDSIEAYISSIESLFEKDKNKYFDTYRRYRYAQFRRMTYFRNNSLFVEKYFYTQPIRPDNPAYMTLFNSVFANCFSPESQFGYIRKALPGLKNTNFGQITDSINKMLPAENKDLAILISIKGLYDLYYQYEAVGEDIITTFENAKTTNKELNSIIANAYQDLVKMRKGYPAPEFKLRGKGNRFYTPDKFKGNFVYLNFCHPQSMACKDQLPMLEKYYNMSPKGLKIVTIVYGLNRQEFKAFVKEHKNYKWLFLYGPDMPELLNSYRVAAFPTYYLIDPEGKVYLSPAPTPEENFEQQYNAAYRQWIKQKETGKNGIRSQIH